MGLWLGPQRSFLQCYGRASSGKREGCEAGDADQHSATRTIQHFPERELPQGEKLLFFSKSGREGTLVKG
jgi:hypothetical protein